MSNPGVRHRNAFGCDRLPNGTGVGDRCLRTSVRNPLTTPPKESSHAPFGERIPERQVREGAFPPARERLLLRHNLSPESDIFMISGISFPGRSQGSGAWERIRTTDTRIFNPLLYQLSYPGALRRAGAGSIGERMRGVQRPQTNSLSVLAVVLRQVIHGLARKHIDAAQPALQIHVRTAF